MPSDPEAVGPPSIRAAVPWSWAATAEERTAAYPCDGLLADADDFMIRAVSVRAPAEIAFRWLCQMRLAPYSYDFLDNGFRRSPRRLTPGMEELAVGQRFMSIFELVAFEPGRHLTLRLNHPGAGRVFGQVALTYAIRPASPGRCRLVCKLAIRYPRRGPARAMRWLLPWGDLIMMRKQLLTLARLAEERSG